MLSSHIFIALGWMHQKKIKEDDPYPIEMYDLRQTMLPGEMLEKHRQVSVPQRKL